MYRFAMERAEILSEILRDQIRGGAPRETLLWTLGMIRSEILAMPPAAGSPSEPVSEMPAEAVGAGVGDRVMQDEEPLAVPPVSDSVATRPSEALRDLSTLPSRPTEAASVPAETSQVRHTDHLPPVEINQTVADGGTSLNDRLRKGAPELAERLMPEAVKDLRKAFGINDRFRLINELFGGDGAAFDEAVIRLDGMTGMNDAMACIDRELAVQRGWDASGPLVEQLRQSVRRRFSSM